MVLTSLGSPTSSHPFPAHDQNKKIRTTTTETTKVPKKTKLYVEQTQREKLQAGEIHRAFQKDLCRLRLTAARAYVGTITDGRQGISAVGGAASLRLHAQCQGLVSWLGERRERVQSRSGVSIHIWFLCTNKQ